jgi:hypothetical protein
MVTAITAKWADLPLVIAVINAGTLPDLINPASIYINFAIIFTSASFH